MPSRAAALRALGARRSHRHRQDEVVVPGGSGRSQGQAAGVRRGGHIKVMLSGLKTGQRAAQRIGQAGIPSTKTTASTSA